MCAFIRQSEPLREAVNLEVSATGGKLYASVSPPAAVQTVLFNNLPLLRAVKMAKLMANLFETDVAIIDRLGIWHEWLVEWACEPMRGAASGADSTAVLPLVQAGRGAGETHSVH